MAHEIDTIVYATGFNSTKFLWPITVKGKGGVRLDEFWAGNPAAYMGLTVPHFPNMYMCYGPNTNIGM